MFILILLLVVFDVTNKVATTTVGVISDPHFALPNCTMMNHPGLSLTNHMGTFTIESDAFGHDVTFLFTMGNGGGYSCALCMLVSEVYCNTSLGEKDVTLSRDTSFNVVIAAATSVGLLPLRKNHLRNQFHFLQSANNTIRLDQVMAYNDNNHDCNDPLFFIVLPVLTISRMYNFVATSHPDTPSPMEYSLPCNDAKGQYPFAQFDCTIMGARYYYISHQRATCLGPRRDREDEDDSTNTNDTRKELLYWYDQALKKSNENTTYIESTLKDTFLCNESLYDLLVRSNTSLYCCTEKTHFYVAMNQWLELALQLITLKLNAGERHLPMEYLLAMDTLERGCTNRNDHKQSKEEGALFAKLARFNKDSIVAGDIVAHHLNCLALLETLGMDNFDSLSRGFTPVYLDFYKEWYFEWLSFIILYTVPDMRRDAIIFLSFTSTAIAILLASLVILPLSVCLKRCNQFCKDRLVFNHHYVPLASNPQYELL